MTSRPEHVQGLRALALQYGIERVRDDASRSKVLEMVGALRGKPLPATEKANLEERVLAYLQTFPGAVLAAPPQGNAGDSTSPGFRLCGRSFLFTYNWKFMTSP